MQAERKILGLFRLVFLVVIGLSSTNIVICKTVVLFSPDDGITKHLINRFNRAKRRIYAAIYMLTDRTIAQALIDAKNRGVDVQIVSDSVNVTSNYGKVGLLKRNGVETHIFYKTRPQRGKTNQIMHDKFAVIDDGVWTGSFNWTISANRYNQENVIWCTAKSVLAKFVTQFEKLKARCRPRAA